jgi:nucleoside-diphosphate-sugar epimerase
MRMLSSDAAAVFKRRAPAVAAVRAERGWRFPSRLDRVYVDDRARRGLGWQPRFDLNAIAQMVGRRHRRTPLARRVGSKAYAGSTYHRGTFRP